ncbi:MAG: hypothetical protein HYW50_01325, partial [Candidatus Diapherotrites archaeon]|nr:hypothetical protein [Candidatus Diapherotrites archaeon]
MKKKYIRAQTMQPAFAFWGEDTEKDICNLGFDGEELDIADGYCRFRYTLNNGTPSDWVYFSPEGNFQQHREEYNFGQDSKHFVEIECKDIAGNVTTVTETDTVETMPPEFFPLDFEGPEFKEDNVQWIDGITKVILQVQDPQPHPTEVNTIFWRNVIVRDKYCSQSCSPCEFTEGTIGGCPDFNEVAGIAGINTLTLEGLQQSCNLLEYYAVDNIGNKSPTISS